MNPKYYNLKVNDGKLEASIRIDGLEKKILLPINVDLKFVGAGYVECYLTENLISHINKNYSNLDANAFFNKPYHHQKDEGPRSDVLFFRIPDKYLND